MGSFFFEKFANAHNPNSFAYRARQKRIYDFLKMMNPKKGDIILDIGSSDCSYFEKYFYRNSKLIAVDIQASQRTKLACNLVFIRADACALPFKDKTIDIAFSNSVIEHVGDDSKQKAFAQEINRVAKKYFIQTPNKFFPIEPHYFFPFFQFLPSKIKITLRNHFSLGWYNKRDGEEINLLSKRKIEKLFPGAKIVTEKFLGFVKSYYIVWNPYKID